MDTTKIKPCHIFVAVSLVANMLLVVALGSAAHKRDMHWGNVEHMLAQRIAVLEVEHFITGLQPWLNTAEIRGYAVLIVHNAT